MPDPPIFINCRDRVEALGDLVAWLEEAGHQRIILLDNDSTWEPMVDYLHHSPHEVRYLKRNVGSRAIWIAGMAPKDEPYVYTDPDIVPVEQCPKDLVERLGWVLDHYGACPKAGPGLYLDDLPDDHHILDHERSLLDGRQGREIDPGIYATLIDTTFALYRAGEQFGYNAIRLAFPYVCRHTSWYMNELDPENAHYLSRARGGTLGSSWRDERVH